MSSPLFVDPHRTFQKNRSPKFGHQGRRIVLGPRRRSDSRWVHRGQPDGHECFHHLPPVKRSENPSIGQPPSCSLTMSESKGRNVPKTFDFVTGGSAT